VKQAVLHRALALRARAPALFAKGSYTALRIEGPAAGHALAFMRQHAEQTVITLVSRLSASVCNVQKPLIPPEFWRGTHMVLPRSLHGRPLAQTLGAAADGAVNAQGRIRLDRVLATLPVALLEV
jgi:(1->4)-alpha-D-glucan 1-alpha-D-glucosylmutase